MSLAAYDGQKLHGGPLPLPLREPGDVRPQALEPLPGEAAIQDVDFETVPLAGLQDYIYIQIATLHRPFLRFTFE